MDGHCVKEERLRLAEQVRNACVEAALSGYLQASLSGLCHEGAWEAAVDAVRQLDLESLLPPEGQKAGSASDFSAR